MIALAKVGRPYGLTGAMHVYPFSNDFSTLKRAKTLQIGVREFSVKNVREHGTALVMLLDGIDSPELAQTLTNAEISVDRALFPVLPDGEFYWIDLVGLTCTNGERVFGEIVEVFEAGAHPILRVRAKVEPAPESPSAQRAQAASAAPSNKPPKSLKSAKPAEDELIPFVDAIVRSVSLTERRVDVDWAGLD